MAHGLRWVHVIERRAAWRALVMETVDPDEPDAICPHVQRRHLYGPDRFRLIIEAQLGRAVGPSRIGRSRMMQNGLEDASEALI